MADREHFLAVVRERIAGGLPTNPLRPIEPATGTTPEITYTEDLSDPVAAFVSAATRVGVEIVDDPSSGALRGLLTRLREEGPVTTAVASRDPEVEPVAGILADLGIDSIPPGDTAAVARADLGITGAAFGIALTGSIVVDSRRAGSRLASLLPPTHLAVLDRNKLLPTPGALFRHFGRYLPDGLPSNLVFITGHSRSADIELRLTPGVHGPRRLLVLLTGGSGASG